MIVYPEDGGSTALRNVGILPTLDRNDTVPSNSSFQLLTVFVAGTLRSKKIYQPQFCGLYNATAMLRVADHNVIVTGLQVLLSRNI
jgi:hypothetical protein